MNDSSGCISLMRFLKVCDARPLGRAPVANQAMTGNRSRLGHGKRRRGLRGDVRIVGVGRAGYSDRQHQQNASEENCVQGSGDGQHKSARFSVRSSLVSICGGEWPVSECCPTTGERSLPQRWDYSSLRTLEPFLERIELASTHFSDTCTGFAICFAAARVNER